MCDESPPLPLFECSDGSSYPITVDPIDILHGKFVLPPPAPTPRPPRDNRGGSREGRYNEKRSFEGSSANLANLAYVDVDAPKTSEVTVDYGSALELVPLPKKKKRKKVNKV